MNNDGMLRPRNPAAVQVPDAMASAPGMANRGGMGMNLGMGGPGQPGTQMTGGDIIRNLLSQNLGNNPTGGFNWGNSNSSMYEDDVLRSLKVNNDQNPESMQYYVERVAGAMQLFIQQIFHRAGPLFEEYKRARENFRMTEMGAVCELRNAFIDEVNKQHDFTRIVALCGAPFFGKNLIAVLQSSSQDQPSRQEYLNAVWVASRDVLFFEFINWLMKSPVGKQYALRIPQNITAKLANLENFKEAASAAFDVFGQTSPYSNLEFKRPESTRPDYAMLYGPASDYVHATGFDGPTQRTAPSDPHMHAETMQMIHRHAAMRRGEYRPAVNTVDNVMGGGTVVNWNNVRNDLNNLTVQNRDEFNLSRFFHHIGKPNHFFIPETDWRNIQHAYRKHAEMGQEETVMPGCFRIVIIDFTGDTGWFSTIVRKEGLTMANVLTDPMKLLPALEDPENFDTWKVKPVAVDKVAKDKLHIDVPTCVKLEKDVPLIVVAEAIVSNSSKDLESTITTVNNRLTANFTKENATGISALAWDTYTCQTPEDKVRLFCDAPFLFKDSNITEGPTFFQACKALNAYFAQGIISSELCDFIDSRLTDTINNWLVNCGGYSPIKGKGFLSVDSVVRDYRDLSDHLKEVDEQLFYFLHQSDKPHTLIEELKIFTSVNRFRGKEGEELSAVDALKEEVELLVERPLYMNTINKRGGPIYTAENPVIVMNRAKFPEYFKMVETGFEATMGATHAFDVTDKILRFSDTDNMWLFSYSAIDPNMATLRHISRSKPLCLLAVD